MAVERLNPEQRRKLRNMTEQAVGSKYRDDAEKEFRRDIATRAKDELGISKKLFNRLVNVRYKESLEEVTTEAEDLTELYEIVDSNEPTAVTGGEEGE